MASLLHTQRMQVIKAKQYRFNGPSLSLVVCSVSLAAAGDEAASALSALEQGAATRSGARPAPRAEVVSASSMKALV